MRTRRGHSYASSESVAKVERPLKRTRLALSHPIDAGSGKETTYHQDDSSSGSDPFVRLPEDLLLSIFVCIGMTATAPSDLLGCKQTCKRFNTLAGHPLVLAKLSLSGLRVKPSAWCAGSEHFLQQCMDAGNIEASYSLGMTKFYCLGEREQGIMLMSRAAKVSHPCALHCLAVIQFNGSGGARKHKNLRAGVSLCARAASLGHIDAMRELGHCLQDGYGIVRNVLEGRKLLLEANAREAAAAVMSVNRAPHMSDATLQMTATNIAIGCFHHHFVCQPAYSKLSEVQKVAMEHHHPIYKFLQSGGCSLLSDFGCNVPPLNLHIAHRFLVDWFSLHPPPEGLRLCSHIHCGRPETRRHEFRRCSACGSVNYCSRACQALDWKLRHKFLCVPAAVNNWQHHYHGQQHAYGVAAAVRDPPGARHADDIQPNVNDDNEGDEEDDHHQ